LDKGVLYTVKEAAALLGISERMVKHYRATYVNDVVMISPGRIAFTDKFIEKVKGSRAKAGIILIESRTKADLLKEIEDKSKAIENKCKENEILKNTIKDIKKENVFILNKGIEFNNKNNQRDNQELLKEIQELKEIISDYENSEVYEKANEGFRVEVFSQDEYNLFSERLIQWRLQRQEIESTKVHFESLKDERDFIKGQLDYFKSSNDKILQQHQNLIEIIGQRNRIEAVEKGAIKREPREI